MGIVEQLSFFTALIVTILTAYLAITDRVRGHRRLVTIVSAGFGFLSFLFLYELDSQAKALEEHKHELVRRWIFDTDATIDAFRLNLLIADGAAHFPSIENWLSGSKLTVKGISLIEDGVTTVLDLSQVMLGKTDTASLEQLGALIGTSNGGFDCLASQYVTEQLAVPKNGSGSPITCSISMTVRPKRPRRLSDFAKVQSITLELPKVAPECAIGSCSERYFSLQAQVRSDPSDILPDFIEFSPAILAPIPTDEIDQRRHYEVKGSVLLDLAKEHFLASYNARNRSIFPFTLGRLYANYRDATTRTETLGGPLDIVWSTDPTPPLKDAQDKLIPPEARGQFEAFSVREWCGYGKDAPCWHIFLLMRSSSESER